MLQAEVMRVILDNMLWGYVGQTDSREALEQCAIARGWKILTPPATLLESLRDSNADRRLASVRALTSRHWGRLPTEAEMEAREVVAEAKRTRHGWVRQVPLPGEPASLRAFWTHRIWRSAARDPARLAALHSVIEGPTDKAAYQALKWNRDARLKHNWMAGPLDEITVTPIDDTPEEFLSGWDGRVPVEAWRVEGREVYRYALRSALIRKAAGADTTHADWIFPYLWPDRVTRDWADFSRFWLFDVDKTNMPRNWIRWATETAQMMGKVRESDPRDGQLASYLFDCDVFLTEDGPFTRVLDRVKTSCPVRLADIRRIKIHPDDSRVVEIIESALT